MHGSSVTDPARDGGPRLPTTARRARPGDIFAVGADELGRWIPKRVGDRRSRCRGAGRLHRQLDVDDLLRDRSDRHRGGQRPEPTSPIWPTRRAAPRSSQGDARLSLADEPDATYDLLVMDAFSSDAIPVHLLTRRGDHRRGPDAQPDGVIAFHVSNRYYDLSPADRRRAAPSSDVDPAAAQSRRRRDGRTMNHPSEQLDRGLAQTPNGSMTLCGPRAGECQRCRPSIHRRLRRSALATSIWDRDA